MSLVNGQDGATHSEIGRFLGQHYGDRMVYLRDRHDRRLFRQAVRQGLVSADGYVTAEGYGLWRRHAEDE